MVARVCGLWTAEVPARVHSLRLRQSGCTKGGTLQQSQPDRRTSFDKFNPYTIKGNSPAALGTLMFETLAVRSGDEPDVMYGVLAEDIQVAPDKSWIAFRMNPKARFTNGDAVTAADVKYSFDMLTSKEASPSVRTQLAGVAGVAVLDARTIRFDLKERTADTIFNVGNLPVFSPKWGRGADGKAKKLDEIVNEYPIASGPYTIASTDSARRIDFQRDPNYWGRDQGFARGQYNFDRIVYRYYQDNAIAMEAFKAGEFDFLMEYSARRWVRQHVGPKWDDKRIVKESFPSGFGMGYQSYIVNLRKPLFQDRRVRAALNLAYDFAAINVYKEYKRTESLFANSDFAAAGLPSPAELALLEPFRGDLPPGVFGPAWQESRTDLDVNGLRNNLRKARRLLEDAGGKSGPTASCATPKANRSSSNGSRRGDALGRREAVFQHNLALLGIKLNTRLVDFAIYAKRLESFDFDMINIKMPGLGTAECRRSEGRLRERCRRRAGLEQSWRRQEQGSRRTPRPHRQGNQHGANCGRRRARSIASSCMNTSRCRTSTGRSIAYRAGTNSASPRPCPSTTR